MMVNRETSMRKIATILLLVAGLALQSACGDDMDLGPIAATPKKAPVPRVENPDAADELDAMKKMPALAGIENIAQRRLRDPFRSYLTDMAQGNTSGGGPIPTPPLQQYDVDQFIVLGIVFGIANPTALIEDPSGNTHSIKIGTIVGRNWGKVVKIRKDEVVVNEDFTDPSTGKHRTNQIRLKLKVNTIGGMPGQQMLDEDGEKIEGEDQAGSAEDDRFQRLREVLDTQQSMQKMWQPSAPGGSSPSGPPTP